MRLLEVLECKVVLGNREPAQVHDELVGDVILDSSSQSLLVPLKDHIHQYLELIRPLLGAEAGVVCCLTGCNWIALGVASLERDASPAEAASVD